MKLAKQKAVFSRPNLNWNFARSFTTNELLEKIQVLNKWKLHKMLLFCIIIVYKEIFY